MVRKRLDTVRDEEEDSLPFRKKYSFRYIIIAVFFVFLCLTYSTVVIIYNAKKDKEPDVVDATKYVERTVTLQAIRGEIYDRNGVLLVKNNYEYSVIFDYSMMSLTYAGQNEDILSFYRMVDDLNLRDSLCESLSPFSGTYPDITVDSDKLQTSLSKSRYNRILKELSLDSDADAEAVVKALCKKYRMTDSKGNALYTEAEMTDLLNWRYDTEAIQFAPGEPYKVLSDVGMDVISRVKESDIQGVRIWISYSREYCYPGYASHILGRIGKIFAENAEYYTSQGYPITAVVGLDGCEYVFEKYLRGMDGEMKIVEDENGNIVSTEIVKEPETGLDVYLTIDINLQTAAEDGLKENVQYVVRRALTMKGKYNGEDCESGALIAQKTNTGELLVVASYPSYDLSTFNEDYAALLEDSRTPLFNRALEGTYAPGSTFKVGIAAMALMEKIKMRSGETFTANTYFNATGVYKYYDDYQPVCWLWTQKKQAHGYINVTKAIQVSCNCFFYELGRILKIDTINRYCRSFGLGQNTGVELYENTGILADPEYANTIGEVWTGGITLQTAIGQGYNKFSPIQLSTYISTVVNGGTRWATHLLKEVKTVSGDVVYSYVPEVLSTANINTSTVNVIKNAMSKVVDENTSFTAFDGFPVKVGGKTGTAQVNNQSSNAVFVCFAPLDNPEITVSVVIERGQTGANAARSARAVMDAYFIED